MLLAIVATPLLLGAVLAATIHLERYLKDRP